MNELELLNFSINNNEIQQQLRFQCNPSQTRTEGVILTRKSGRYLSVSEKKTNSKNSKFSCNFNELDVIFLNDTAFVQVISERTSIWNVAMLFYRTHLDFSIGMKYPQLVPTRAVNAISDWLVSRLEQLGVEAPQIYSRLLLSLLQSSVQINDPIEFSNLETFFANRKGSNRRYPRCEPSSLKKINAVQCLREIVSSEQEISTIEVLVDELFEKLIAIEKQYTDVDQDDYQTLAATLSVDTGRLNSPLNQSHKFYKHHNAIKEGEILKSGCSAVGNNISKAIRGKVENRSKHKELSDNESDPKKRYFRAFPALTKEMEDSFRVLKRNTKSLTWPVDKYKINKSSILCKDSNSRLEIKSMNVKQIGQRKTEGVGIIVTGQKQPVHTSNNENVMSTVVKRKTRRRRHQGLSKANNRINSCGNGNNGKHRSLSPFWDTDFEGCWEMGRDLIKEFIMKQNNRNRTSETLVYTDKKQLKRKQWKDPEMFQVKQKSEKPAIDTQTYSPLIPPLDISFCYNMDNNDTLASVSEITEASMSSTSHIHNINDNLHELVSETVSDDRFDVEQFKAKFDSSLEALWKNIPSDTGENVNGGNGAGTHSISSSIMQLTSLSSAPLKDSLQNVCSNIYNHSFDLEKNPPESQTNGDNSHNLCCSGFGKDITNTNNYYSMPYNLKQFDKSTNMSCDVPFNVFLQNSIWSDGSHGIVATDAEQNSYKRGWDSPQKSNQFEVISAQVEESETCSQENAFKLPSKYGQSKWSEGINAGPNITTFSIQPAPPFLHVQLNSASSSSSIISSCSVDHVKHLGEIGAARALNADQHTVDSATSATTSCSSYSTHCNWQTPLLGQSLQPDMQSWSSSNPISLTEMYGSSGGTNDGKRVTGRLYVKPSINETVTLTNHCSSSSSFIEYERIKLSSVKASKHDNATTRTVVEKQPQHFPIRTKECYAPDEDLLNSDLTHFRPIKPYEDGHSFYICSALDIVEYERSESGYLYWDSEKYLEYTRKDSFLSEEDQSVSLNSGAPLYTTYSPENPADQCNFVMKFRLRNCDAACQTEDKSTIEMSMPFTIKQDPLRSMFSTSLQSMQLQTNTFACNDAIKALSKAVVAAAKVAGTCNTFDDSHWLPPVNCYHSVTAWTSKTKELMEAVSSDEVDFQTSKAYNALQQWSMHEIGKKCELNNEENAANTHTLWGMCAACNNEFKSIPANTLLKDELQLEADEIMSDLKYMQDLYIDESKWDTEETQAKTIDLVSSRKFLLFDDSNITSPISEIRDIDPEEKELNLKQQNHAAQNVFKKVNRLIADLLCRDSCKPSTNYAVSEDTDVQFIGSLRNNNDEYNIWQQDSVDFTPIDFLTRLNNDQQNPTVLRTEEDQFLAKLSWEHDYLAEIWEKRTPPLGQHSNEICKIGEHSEIIRRNFKNVFNVPGSPVLRIGENFMATCSKYKATNRKRRHSASQNIYLALPSNNVSNNNNDLHIANFNQFDIKTKSCSSQETKNTVNSIACELTDQNNSNVNTEEAAKISQPKQTIITCKYWTIDPTVSPTTQDILQGSAFSCLLNKNTSILKHVTMGTRPLTR